MKARKTSFPKRCQEPKIKAPGTRFGMSGLSSALKPTSCFPYVHVTAMWSHYITLACSRHFAKSKDRTTPLQRLWQASWKWQSVGWRMVGRWVAEIRSVDHYCQTPFEIADLCAMGCCLRQYLAFQQPPRVVGRFHACRSTPTLAVPMLSQKPLEARMLKMVYTKRWVQKPEKIHHVSTFSLNKRNLNRTDRTFFITAIAVIAVAQDLPSKAKTTMVSKLEKLSETFPMMQPSWVPHHLPGPGLG